MADRRLAVWTLASFHTAGFTLAFVVTGHATGILTDTLPEFGTALGFLGYGYLWVLSYLATRWALSEAVLAATMDGALRGPLLRGAAGGGFVGVATLLGPLLVVAVPGLLSGSGDPVPFLLLTAYVGVIATIIGLVVGFVFSVIDVATVRLSGFVVED